MLNRNKNIDQAKRETTAQGHSILMNLVQRSNDSVALIRDLTAVLKLHDTAADQQIERSPLRESLEALRALYRALPETRVSIERKIELLKEPLIKKQNIVERMTRDVLFEYCHYLASFAPEECSHIIRDTMVSRNLTDAQIAFIIKSYPAIIPSLEHCSNLRPYALHEMHCHTKKNPALIFKNSVTNLTGKNKENISAVVATDFTEDPKTLFADCEKLAKINLTLGLIWFKHAMDKLDDSIIALIMLNNKSLAKAIMLDAALRNRLGKYALYAYVVTFSKNCTLQASQKLLLRAEWEKMGDELRLTFWRATVKPLLQEHMESSIKRKRAGLFEFDPMRDLTLDALSRLSTPDLRAYCMHPNHLNEETVRLVLGSEHLRKLLTEENIRVMQGVISENPLVDKRGEKRFLSSLSTERVLSRRTTEVESPAKSLLPPRK